MSSSIPNRPLRFSPGRREFLYGTLAGSLTASCSGWLPLLAENVKRMASTVDRRCIVLWMSGGPSQIDTFDPKPDHTNGGPFKAIETSVPGIRVSEHLPKLARQMEHLALIRSMQTREGDHSRATYLMKTGYLPVGGVSYPSLGAVIAHQFRTRQIDLPNYISINPSRFQPAAATTSGFLGSRYNPLILGQTSAQDAQDPQDLDHRYQVRNLRPPDSISPTQFARRLRMLDEFEQDFASARPDSLVASKRDAHEQALRMMDSEAAGAFRLDEEPDSVRDAYGRNPFGQACLLARRLVERHVAFVEVALNSVTGAPAFGWDTHQDNFTQVEALCGVLDPGFANLIDDLRQRGLLESTQIVWMGEFGRTPGINGSSGRDHFPDAWSAVIGGGAIRGGQVIGKTSDSGVTITDRPISVPDLLSTVYRGIGLDPATENISRDGRPIRLADSKGSPIQELLT